MRGLQKNLPGQGRYATEAKKTVYEKNVIKHVLVELYRLPPILWFLNSGHRIVVRLSNEFSTCGLSYRWTLRYWTLYLFYGLQEYPSIPMGYPYRSYDCPCDYTIHIYYTTKLIEPTKVQIDHTTIPIDHKTIPIDPMTIHMDRTFIPIDPNTIFIY